MPGSPTLFSTLGHPMCSWAQSSLQLMGLGLGAPFGTTMPPISRDAMITLILSEMSDRDNS